MSEEAQVSGTVESNINPVLDQLFKKNTITLPKHGSEVLIRKVTLKTMKPVTTFIGRIIGDLKLDENNLPTISLTDPSTILKLISEHYDEVVGLAVLFCNLEQEKLENLELDESAMVVAGIIELNKNFFTKTILPNLQKLGLKFDVAA